MTITKAHIVEHLSENFGFDPEESKCLVEGFFEEMRCILEEGASLKISGFGNFNLRDKKERPGRNPKTGEDVPIKARRVVTFHAGQKLKNSIKSAKLKKNK